MIVPESEWVMLVSKKKRFSLKKTAEEVSAISAQTANLVNQDLTDFFEIHRTSPRCALLQLHAQPIVMNLQFGVALPPQVVGSYRLPFPEIDDVALQAMKRE
jgi:hypothetical protein